MSAPRIVARAANVGLVLFGTAIVVVLGTGGARIDLPFVSIGLRRLAPPTTFFCFFAALRLLVGSRHSGIEAWLVTLLARQGLPPRDAPTNPPAGARAGFLLGAGFGCVAAGADLVRLAAATPRPAPPLDQYLALIASVGVLGVALGGAAGVACGLVVALAARFARHSPGRYEAGRWTVAGLTILAPGLLWLAPLAGRADHTPFVLLSAASAVPVGLALAFVLGPAAVVRARRGRWGLAVGVIVALAMGLALMMTLALGPTGLYGPAREANYPNVLLVTISGLRWDHVAGPASDGRFTPTLTALGARGASFRTAVSTSTAVGPAALSILTSLYPASHGLRGPGERLRPGVEGLPLALAAHGFRTAAFVSCSALNGRETGLADLFEHYDDPTAFQDWLGRTALGSIFVRSSGRPPLRLRTAEETTAAFRIWSEAMPPGPWFAWVEFSDAAWPRPAHADPAEDTTGGGAWAARIDGPVPLAPSWAAPEDRERPLADWVHGYREALRRVDRAVDALQRIVAARGEQHHTLIVVAAEHGVPLGEGGYWLEPGRDLSEGVILSPWIVAGPGVRPATSVAGPASLVDLAPTILGLIGLGGGSAAEGEDLSRHLLVGRRVERDPQSGPVFAETAGEEGTPRLRAVRFGRWKLVRLPGGRERLYLAEDGVDSELATPRGSVERERARLSDMLTRRQSDEAEFVSSPSS